jgi:Flp pilus assembly pilin Flp
MSGIFLFFHARRNAAGMSILEYTVLITALLAAILSVQVYLRRAISSKWRDAADSFGLGRQYETDGSKATTVVRH